MGHTVSSLVMRHCAACEETKGVTRAICGRVWTWNAPRMGAGFGPFESVERLVGPEADDGQPEGVHGQLVVLHLLAEDVSDAGCPLLPLEF